MPDKPSHSTTEVTERKFVWPPRKPLPVEVLSRERGKAASPPLRGGKRVQPGFWRAFESAFLDLSAGPLADRVLEAGWKPDVPGDYCPRCARTLRPGSLTAAGCADCEGIAFAWERFIRLGEYQGPLGGWVREVKFTRWRRLGVDLGKMLGESLAKELAARSGLSQLPPVIVPVPDHPIRRVWRGIDHAAVICSGVQATTGWDVARPLYRRLGRSQLSVPPSQRARNAAKSFGINTVFRCETLRGRTVFVVDDVATTGATLRACCRLIASACKGPEKGREPRIWAACLAKSSAEQASSAARLS